MSDDEFKTGTASAPRTVYTGKPDDYEAHNLLAGDKIPKGAKPRPWLLGKPATPKAPAKKPATKKSTPKKK